MRASGLLITFEGIDGSGKSTQATLLRDFLTESGYGATFVREPGGTPVSEKIRRILLDRGNIGMSFRAELLLYLAARAEVVDKVIVPALAAGNVVIADRFYDSTYAYQIGGRLLPARVVRIVNKFAAESLVPDLTFLVDIPVRIARKRLQREKDRLEAEGIYFQQRVRDGFLELARAEPRRIRVLDGRENVEDLFVNVRKTVLRLLKRRKIEPTIRTKS
jgi:dTMP kinase